MRFVFLVGLVLAVEGQAGTAHPDLSVSVALPSLSGAVVENPAGLAGGSGRELELGVNAGALSNIDAYGVFASGKGSFGFGLQITRAYMGSLGATAGVGAKMGRLAFGLNASSSIMAFNPSFGAGLALDMGKGMIGIYVPSLNNPTQAWILGFGVGGSTLIFGVDARFTTPLGGIAPNGATLIPAVEFLMAHKLAVKVAYSLTVMPTFNSGGIGAGVQYWVGHSWAVFGLYNTGMYPLTLGLNFAL